MFTNYSQTYAASITTIAGFAGLYLSKFGFANSDIELSISTIVTLAGLVWQIVHRYRKGGVTVAGIRK